MPSYEDEVCPRPKALCRERASQASKQGFCRPGVQSPMPYAVRDCGHRFWGILLTVATRTILRTVCSGHKEGTRHRSRH
ncbi:hypothetical protein H6P81_021195 [Aristolochia fimbriata]|uniref:Uncharacterized protein n=1 Tax=Aristolochia fimbriata TaxID=158543 RepID=A0AAV7DUB9_ARIFI|nr:hypothetical protein H6P81_021195 [Aristolochia fimbriata]